MMCVTATSNPNSRDFNSGGIEDFQGPYSEWKGKHN